MALLYPWATKEYLLWQMSIGQIMLYLTLGFAEKYPKSKEDEERENSKPLSKMNHEEIQAWKDNWPEEWKRKYGAVED